MDAEHYKSSPSHSLQHDHHITPPYPRSPSPDLGTTTFEPSPAISFGYRELGDLQFIPCNLQESSRLGHHTVGAYELCEGLLVKKEMADNEHCSIAQSLHMLIFLAAEKIKDRVVVYNEHGVSIPHLLTDQSGTSALGSSGNAPSPTNADTQQSATPTRRKPDVVVHNQDDNSSSDSSTSPERKRSRHRSVSEKDALMVVEVTSVDRKKDLVVKKKEYESAKIPCYVIVDRVKGTKMLKKKVIVHLHNREKYETREFVDDDVVVCKYFKEFKLTAAQMLNHKSLRKLVQNVRKKQRDELDKEKNRADNAEERADNAEERTVKAEEENKKLTDYESETQSTMQEERNMTNVHTKASNVVFKIQCITAIIPL